MSVVEVPVERSSLSSALERLNVALDEVARVVDFTADPSVLGEAVTELVATRNRFDALTARYMGQVETSGAPQVIGVRTVGQFVAAQTNADPAAYRAAATTAKWLRDFPAFEEACAEGAMSRAHVEQLRRHLDGPRTRCKLGDDQELFVDAARDCSFADFKKVVEYWLIRVDPDGDEPAEQKDRTSLSLRTGRGGRLFVKGELDATSGQLLQTAMAKVAKRLRREDVENGTVRSEGERAAKALIELVTTGAARPDGSHAVPLINIVMSQTVAEYLLEQAVEPTGDPVPVHWNDVDGRCELIDGTPIHPKHALQLFGLATFRRHVMDAKGRLIDVAVNSRSFPQWMRNALHVQARGACETPGCDAPHRWIQADHADPHSRGGKTRLANGQNLCAADNQAKTNLTGQPLWRDRRPSPRRKGPRATVAASASGDDDH